MAMASSSARRKAEMNSGMSTGTERLDPVGHFAGVQLRAARLLRVHDLIRLLDEGGE